MAIVYKATNHLTGDFYIGMTMRLLSLRKARHHTDANAGSPTAFHRAIRKYGKAAFLWEVLIELPTVDEVAAEEIRLIGELNPKYNLTAGGEGPLSAAARCLIGFANKGRKASAETKTKMSLAHIGKKMPTSHSAATAQRNRERIWTEEMRGRTSAALKGRTLPPEHVENARRGQIGRKPTVRRRVICLDDGREFDSGRDAERFYDLRMRSVAEACRKPSGMVNGKRFAYISERIVVSKAV